MNEIQQIQLRETLNETKESKKYIKHYISEHTENWSEIKDIWQVLNRINSTLEYTLKVLLEDYD